MRKLVLALPILLVVAGCGGSVEDQMENAVREGLAPQGTVKQVELTRDGDRLTGFAIVEPRDAPGTEARFSCTAERQSSSSDQYSWTCAPDAAAPAGASPQASGGKDAPAAGGPGRAALAGRWTDDGNCGNAILLGEDGVFVAPNGARGNWTVEGDRLTLSGPNGSVAWTVYVDDPNTITLTDEEGQRSRSTRC